MSEVARQLNILSEQIMRAANRRLSHKEQMADIELSGARLDYQRQRLTGEQDIQKSKIQRENWLNEEVTAREAINGSKLPDEAKERLLNSVPPEILDGGANGELIFKRGKWAEGLRNALTKQQERDAKAAERTETQQFREKQLAETKRYHTGQLGIARERLKAEKEHGGKDTRTASQKEYDRYKQENQDYKGSFLDFRRALKKKDPKEAALGLAQQDDRFKYSEDAKERQAVIDEYYGYLTGEKPKTETIQLPDNISKTSEALQFLMEQHGMDEQSARDYIRKNY